jgi:hypothetical protein
MTGLPSKPRTTTELEDSLRRLAAAQGQPDLPGIKNGRAHCPSCGPLAGNPTQLWTLTVTETPDGLSYSCSNMCSPQVIAALIRTGQNVPTVATVLNGNLAESALEQVRTTLRRLDAGRHRIHDLDQVVQYGDEGDAIELHFTSGKVLDLGEAEQLVRQDHFKRRVARAGIVADKLKPADYDDLVRAIFDASQRREGADTANEEADDWIATFVRASHTSTFNLADTAQAIEAIKASERYPFRDETGRVHLRAKALARWLKLEETELVTPRTVAMRLARRGWEATQLSVRDGGEVRKARVWAAPTVETTGETSRNRPHI